MNRKESLPSWRWEVSAQSRNRLLSGEEHLGGVREPNLPLLVVVRVGFAALYRDESGSVAARTSVHALGIEIVSIVGK